MKRLFTSMLLCIAMMPILLAQDIIVTNTSERIDALITEISATEVRYKKANNPNGPTFVLTTDKIASIIYKNGEVQTFQQADKPQQSLSNGTITTVREASDIVFVPGQKIVKAKNRSDRLSTTYKYYYGDIGMDEGLYKDFLKLTCADAYKQYVNASGMEICGYTIFGLLGLIGTGGLLSEHEDMMIAGGLLTGLGFAVGIPIGVVGGRRTERALDIFNNQCASSLDYQQTVTLNLGVTQNGVGLTLNF